MTPFPPGDQAAIEGALRAHDRQLALASRALPPDVRRPWLAVLAFRRAARDAVDAEARRSLDDLRERVGAAFDGRPAGAALDRAMTSLALDYDVPRACFDAVIEAAQWDLDGRRHLTITRLVDYAVRRTGSVAIAAAVLMGRRKREPLERAVDLGVALELTRVARDVGRDAAKGRVHLPIEWLEEAGVDVDRWLDRPRASETLAGVVARVASEAERFYMRADAGMQCVPLGCRPAVRATRWLGVALLRELESAGFDSVETRSGVRFPRALAIAARALYASRGEHTERALRPLPEAKWLVDAAAR